MENFQLSKFPQPNERIYLVFYKSAKTGQFVNEPWAVAASSRFAAETLFKKEYTNEIFTTIDKKDHERAERVVMEIMKLTKASPNKDIKQLSILAKPAAIAAVIIFEDYSNWLNHDKVDVAATAKRIWTEWWK